MADEVTYLEQRGVLVTSGRVEIEGQTFAVRNITSVKVESRNRPLLGLFIAAVGVASFTQNAFMGVPLVGLGAFLVWQAMSKRSLVLVSGAGEEVALTAARPRVELVRDAVVRAIGAR